jgi:hypothetical protein
VIVRFAAVFLLAAFAAGCTTAVKPENSPAPEAAEQAGQRVGEVLRVETGTHADIVIINAGYGRNIRPGMQLSLSRQGKAIASLVVAEATQDGAAALILDLVPNETVKAGDSAKVKTVP